MTESAISTQYQYPGTRSNFTHFVEVPDYEHRTVSSQLWDFVPVGFINKRFRQSLDEFVRIKISILELLRVREGEHDVRYFQQRRRGR